MADFRKWLLAFAVVALLLGTSVSMQAQGNGIGGSGQLGAMTCTAQSTPVLARSEGFTEQVGDIVLSCTGGTPVAAGASIPTSNFRVGLNTNITSRINPLGGSTTANAEGPPSEALLLIDEPGSGATNSPGFSLCPSLTGCPATGGTSPYTATGAYSAYQGIYVANPSSTATGVGAISGYNAVDFLGVPVDAPGTNLTRVIRITNIRADAVGRAGGAAGVLGSIPIVAYVSVGGALSGVSITNSQPTVAYVVQGLLIKSSAFTYNQCNSTTSGSGNSPYVTITEGFSYAFRPRISSSTSTNGLVDDTTGTPIPQNVPGTSYFSESMFTPSGGIASGAATSGYIGVADSGTRFIIRYSNVQNGLTVTVPNVIVGTGNLILSLVTGADQYGAGGSPGAITYTSGTPVTTGTTTLASTSYAGATTAVTGSVVYEVVVANGNVPESFTVPFTVSFTANVQANSPYVTPQGTTDLLTPTSGNSQFSVWLAPSGPSSVTNPTGSSAGNAWNIPQGPYTGNDYQWIPRFTDQSAPANFIGILPCTCNLLFPYVTSATGYDTGIAISNTSMDPFAGFAAAPSTAPLNGSCGACTGVTGTSVTTNAGQVGGVTLWFFGNSTNTSAKTPTLFQIPESTATTAIIVPPGCTFAFELTSASQPATQTLTGCGTAQTATGGLAANNYSINATSATTPLMGFTGYVIATASFQYCHGLAYILPTGTGAPIGGMYLAIELDKPFWASGIAGSTRTGQYGESQGQ
jgi:hypothetical protein